MNASEKAFLLGLNCDRYYHIFKKRAKYKKFNHAKTLTDVLVILSKRCLDKFRYVKTAIFFASMFQLKICASYIAVQQWKSWK